MKIYLTFWTKASRGLGENINTNEINYYLMSQSIRHIKHLNFEAHFITDYNGEKIFGNLGWDSVDTSLESLPSKYKETWSLGKIKAFEIISLKGDPFMHIDHDVCLFEHFPQKFLKADILVETLENCEQRFYNKDYFHKNCINKYLAKNEKLDIAYNCGIIGGKDVEFFYNYANTALKLIFDPMNSKFWLGNHKLFKDFTKAILLEQYYLSCCLDFFNKKPSILINDSVKEKNIPFNGHYIPFDEEIILNTGYIHFYGSFKDRVIRYLSAMDIIKNEHRELPKPKLLKIKK